MSLKAKVEAIIYATEEPVTLDQLASLLRDECSPSCARRKTPGSRSTKSSRMALRRLRTTNWKTTLRSTTSRYSRQPTQNAPAEAP